MKGVVLNCVSELVINKFGKDKWENILLASDLPKDTYFMMREDFEDEFVMLVINAVAAELKLELQEVADAFGSYWVNTFTQRMYKPFYDVNPSARIFLLALNDIHVRMTKNIENAEPPQFIFTENGNILLMEYKSKRQLFPFMVGMLKGLREYFKEEFEIQKVEDNVVKIIFPE